MRKPKITVLMPVYNCANTLEFALDSIVNQTLQPDEIVVVDDASSDDTANILGRFQKYGLRVIRNDSNKGVAASLNAGLRHIDCDLIARMDGDDICHPQRFSVQARLLQQHADVAIVGTAVTIIDGEGKRTGVFAPPASPAAILGYAALSPPFRHPTIMMRGTILADFLEPYDTTLESAEDYGLWARLLPRYKSMNIMQALLRYRVHGGSMTATARTDQCEPHVRASQALLETLAPNAAIDLAAHSRVIRSLVLGKPLERQTVEALLPALAAYNLEMARRYDLHGGAEAAAEQVFILLKIALRTSPALAVSILSLLYQHQFLSPITYALAPLLRTLSGPKRIPVLS